MHRLIDPKRLDAELEAASNRKRERNPALREKLAGAAGAKPVMLRDLFEMMSTASAESAAALHHIAKNAEAELARLEARLDELERTAMVFAGPHDIAREYDPSDVVQRFSGLWIALVATRAGDVPGASPSWRRIAESKA